MHLLLLDLCNEMMQCCLNTCNELMQNALHFSFFHIFSLCSFVNFSNLHRGFSNLTPFSLFHCEVNGPFFKTKLPFLKVINITSFSFHRLQSIRVSFYTKTFILWQWLHFLKSFSPFFESFPIFRVHDASSLRTLTPFVF